MCLFLTYPYLVTYPYLGSRFPPTPLATWGPHTLGPLSLSLSHSLSLSLSPPPPSPLSTSLPHSSYPVSTKRVSPAHIFHPLSTTLSLALFISNKNSTGTILQIPSSTCSHLALHPPPGPYVINPPSASSSPSASIVFAFHRCHHQIVPAAFGCRLYPGHQHQRHRFWCSILQL